MESVLGRRENHHAGSAAPAATPSGPPSKFARGSSKTSSQVSPHPRIPRVSPGHLASRVSPAAASAAAEVENKAPEHGLARKVGEICSRWRTLQFSKCSSEKIIDDERSRELLFSSCCDAIFHTHACAFEGFPIPFKLGGICLNRV